MQMERERALLAEYGRKMSSAGLSHGTAGNLSIYDKEKGWMVITPSGLNYFDLQPEDMVVMDLEGTIVEGTRKPSSEHGLHAAFYKANAGKNCCSVVHTHSNYATTLACMGEPLRAVHYIIASAGTNEIPLCEYATFGTPELAEKAVAACNGGRAVLLANHGLVAFGPNLEKAFALAASLENLAQIQWQCMCAGNMHVLSKEQIGKVLVRYQTYGQAAATDGSLNTY